MSYWAVDAAAGYGKTFRLMQVLGEALAKQPLRKDRRSSRSRSCMDRAGGSTKNFVRCPVSMVAMHA